MDFSSSTGVEFCEKFKKSSYFRIVFDSVSHYEVTTLDLTLFKGPGWMRNGRLDYCLHLKETRQWRPLLPSSAHPKSVHHSWPTAQAARIRKCFSNLKVGRKTAIDFINSLRSIDVHIVAHYPKHSGKHVDHKPVLPRLIFPYCVEWASAQLSKVLNRVSRSYSFLLLNEVPERPPVQIAWELGGRHLVHMLRSFHAR